MVRVRFAPAPTGLMHLGNVRTALMNYLFARQKQGTLVIRIEDTDQQRNFDPGAHQILKDLAWLELSFQEGPGKGGPYEPYFQSQRTAIYQEKLNHLITTQKIYRCFCTAEDLEKKRQRQVALKLPPRYDRTCLQLSPTDLQKNLHDKLPFIWRIKLPAQGTVIINDIARGNIQFDLKNFSDAPLTRQDGSFTFLFANFVDDFVMRITHIFRGEDHLTNTAIQAMLYAAFEQELPTYWHMPIICNAQGKKLSKRDFGFSLVDLQQGGYLPEAICNYLGIIGGSFVTEIMSLADLAKTTDFTALSTAGQIKYDVEKLTWVNHQWITLCDPLKLAQHCLPFLTPSFPQAASMDINVLAKLLQTIKSDLQTLKDCPQQLHFYFVRPQFDVLELEKHVTASAHNAIKELVCSHIADINNPELFVQNLKAAAKTQNIPLKDLFVWLRMALTGQPHGPAIHELIIMLGIEESQNRIQILCK